MSWIRPPAVAGQFYPAQPAALQAMVDGFLAGVAAPGEPCRALVAPHAGYIYSGPVAASAYARLIPLQEQVRRVILLGPAHRAPVRGLAASSAAAWATPLGNVPLDQQAIQELLVLPWVHYDDSAHAPEHGLEVHLPFLQRVLPDFVLAPLVVGEAAPDEVAGVLERFAGEGATVLIISSDLSHYHDYEQACALDQETARTIEQLQPLQAGQACGRHAINGLLQLARRQGWQGRTLDLRNSGDTAGPRDQVVGYGAFLFA
jgi:AmmeMemoRadiSam system protein B